LGELRYMRAAVENGRAILNHCGSDPCSDIVRAIENPANFFGTML
jgi:hypothetical protein